MRNLFISIALIFTPWASSLAATPFLHVVEIANFHCPYCFMMEPFSSKIEQAVEEKGGRFVFAPISVGEQGPWGDYVYYALRQYGKGTEAAVRKALFKGGVYMQIGYENPHQALSVIEQVLKTLPDEYDTLLNEVYADSTKASVEKALFLASDAGVNLLPAFILLENNDIVGVYSRESDDFNQQKLVEKVLNHLDKLGKLH